MFARLHSHLKARFPIRDGEVEQTPPFAKGGAGFTIVEVILSATLFALIVTGLAGVLMYGQESTAIGGQRFRAIMLADEALEAARNMRDQDYANLTDGPHGLSTLGNQWSFAGTSDLTGLFTRQLIITTVDPNRKKLVATVTWQENLRRNGQAQFTTYLTNWRRIVPPPVP